MIERIGEDVGRELSRFGASAGLAALVEAWPAAVGPDVARNAWPARIARDGTLHVHTSSAAWAFELAQLERHIRETLGELAPPGLRFAVGPLPEHRPEATENVRSESAEPSEAQRRRGAELAATIEDENLRKVVAKTVATSLARGESDRSFW